MKIILTEDHDTLGAKGDVVEVKNGYGQNFLIPRRLAVPATASAVKRVTEEARQSAHKVEARNAALRDLVARLDGTSVTISTRTGEGGRLFGSVTNQQVAEAIATAGTDVDRRKVSLASDIRETGEYPATVRLGADAVATVTVRVVSENAADEPTPTGTSDATADEVSGYEGDEDY